MGATAVIPPLSPLQRRPLTVSTITTGKEREHNFQPGDNVEVCEGELINLQGKILSVDGNKITIMPKHEDLKVRGSRGGNTGCLLRPLWPPWDHPSPFLPCPQPSLPPSGHARVPSSGAAEVFQDG